MKRALITGASSGIGRELALLLAHQKIELVLHGRDRTQLSALFVEVARHVQVRLCEAELSSYDGIQRLLKIVHEEKPDLVINNAGFGLYGDLTSQSPQEVQQMIAANCAAVVAICQHVAIWWKQEGIHGTIVNVSSVLGQIPAPGAAVYAATKAFIDSFSQALDMELAPHGIRVLTASPGRVATKFAMRASKGHMPAVTSGGFVLSSQKVAEYIWKQIQKKKPFMVIDWKYRLLLLIKNIFPKRSVMKTLYKALKARAVQ